MTMDGLEKMQENLEKVIEKDGHGTVTSDSDDTTRNQPKTFREKVDHIVHSREFMICIMVLVVLDCLMVIIELLFDLEIVKLGEEHEFVPHIFHNISIAILSLFLVEISMRAFVLRLAFFKHKMEVFDAIIVIVSFVLDIVFRNNVDAASGIGLLVILRLWRIGRIVNSIVISVKKQAEKHIEKEQQLRDVCEKELAKFKEYCSHQEAEIESLQELLRKHDIDFTPKLIQKPQSLNEIDVVAEVNIAIDELAGENTEVETKQRSNEGVNKDYVS